MLYFFYNAPGDVGIYRKGSLQGHLHLNVVEHDGWPIQAFFWLVWGTGNQLSEFTPGSGGSMVLAHTNVWANGVLIATDDVNKTHFYLNDWLGTRRVQTDDAGNLEQSCASLPYGDGETCGPAPTENLYTGKERDAESGNDYFGARYYASTVGRFLSPDWAAKAEPVPYGKLDAPQSLDLYEYMRNSPLGGVDPDGHRMALAQEKASRGKSKKGAIRAPRAFHS